MPRYKANMRFGPWRPGDVFESDDDLHATMAGQGRYLTKVGETGPALAPGWYADTYGGPAAVSAPEPPPEESPRPGEPDPDLPGE